MRRRFTIVVCGLLALLAAPELAAGAPNCVYDPGTRTATLDVRVGLPAPSDRDWRVHRLEARSRGDLYWSSWGSWGLNFMEIPCAGATVVNTDTVNIIGNDTGHETLNFANFAGTEMIFHADLAGAPSIGDEIVVEGPAAGDTITVGETGIALDLSGTLVTLDSEIVKVHVHGGDGNDTISGQGGVGTGPAATIPLGLLGGKGRDRITGGLGRDRIDGEEDDDQLDGDQGDDWLLGSAGADVLTGGAGKDRMEGHGQGDTFFARDGEADTIDGGEGSDRAEIDRGLDVVKKVESF